MDIINKTHEYFRLEGGHIFLKTRAAVVTAYGQLMEQNPGEEVHDGDEIQPLVNNASQLRFRVESGKVSVIKETSDPANLRTTNETADVADATDATDARGVTNSPQESQESSRPTQGDLLQALAYEDEFLATAFELHERIDRALTRQERDLERIIDAVHIAVEQFQEKRIEWAEKGPEVDLGKEIVLGLLGALLTEGLTRAAGVIIKRAFDQRRSAINLADSMLIQANQSRFNLAIENQIQARHQRKLLRDLNELRQIQKGLIRPGATRDSPKDFRINLQNAIKAHENEVQMAALLKNSLSKGQKKLDILKGKKQKIIASVNEAEKKMQAHIGKEQDGEDIAKSVARAIDDLDKREEHTTTAATFALNEVLKYSPKGFKELKKKSDKKREEEKREPSLSDELKDKTRTAMYSSLTASATALFHASGLRNRLMSEIATTRRKADFVLRLAIADSDAASDAAVILAEMWESLTDAPDLTEAEYRDATAWLACEIEFTFWSLILTPVVTTERPIQGTGIGSRELYVARKLNPILQLKGLKKQHKNYFAKRFAHIIGPDFLAIADKMKERREKLKKGKSILLEALEGRRHRKDTVLNSSTMCEVPESADESHEYDPMCYIETPLILREEKDKAEQSSEPLEGSGDKSSMGDSGNI